MSRQSWVIKTAVAFRSQMLCPLSYRWQCILDVGMDDWPLVARFSWSAQELGVVDSAAFHRIQVDGGRVQGGLDLVLDGDDLQELSLH